MHTTKGAIVWLPYMYKDSAAKRAGGGGGGGLPHPTFKPLQMTSTNKSTLA